MLKSDILQRIFWITLFSELFCIFEKKKFADYDWQQKRDTQSELFPLRTEAWPQRALVCPLLPQHPSTCREKTRLRTNRI